MIRSSSTTKTRGRTRFWGKVIPPYGGSPAGQPFGGHISSSPGTDGWEGDSRSLADLSGQVCPMEDTTGAGDRASHYPGPSEEKTLSTHEFTNSLLKALDAETIAGLRLEPVKFELMHEIEYPGNPIEHLFFVEIGMASMTTTFIDGSQVEVGMFGFESVIGVSALMGTRRSLNRVYTQIAGHGYSCNVEVARREFARGDVRHWLYVMCKRNLFRQFSLPDATQNTILSSVWRAGY